LRSLPPSMSTRILTLLPELLAHADGMLFPGRGLIQLMQTLRFVIVAALALPFAVIPLVFFFFSSRRRHTRFDCDWSSDVCSSDLLRSASAATVRDPTLPYPMTTILISLPLR